MLVYSREDLTPIGYTNSDFQFDKDSKKSTFSSLFTLGGRAIVWRSAKQNCTLNSTMEAEDVVTCETTKEAVQLCNFLMDLQVVPKAQEPMTLYCDNSGTVANSKEPRSHKRGKHIQRRYHLLREVIYRGDIIVSKIDTTENLVDPFTKGLVIKVFEGHLEGMRLRNMHTCLKRASGRLLEIMPI